MSIGVLLACMSYMNEGVRSVGAVVRDSCEPACGYWELDLCLLEE